MYYAKHEEEANELIRKVRPEFVVMIGLEDYGKTTFLGSLYHQFRCNGKVGGQLLIDSDTLSGFEYKVFLRVMNTEGLSDVVRTSGKDAFILSLNLQDEADETDRQLIISDRAGETYFKYLSDNDLIAADKTLQRADRILLFVDSEKMVSDTDYLAMKDDYKMLLKRLKDAGKYPEKAVLYVVFNKYDKRKKTQKKKYLSRKQEMLEVFKVLKETADRIFEVDSKHLLETDNTSDIWELQKILVNPLIDKK